MFAPAVPGVLTGRGGMMYSTVFPFVLVLVIVLVIEIVSVEHDYDYEHEHDSYGGGRVRALASLCLPSTPP